MSHRMQHDIDVLLFPLILNNNNNESERERYLIQFICLLLIWKQNFKKMR